jgi:hypothetical protein
LVGIIRLRFALELGENGRSKSIEGKRDVTKRELEGKLDNKMAQKNQKERNKNIKSDINFPRVAYLGWNMVSRTQRR